MLVNEVINFLFSRGQYGSLDILYVINVYCNKGVVIRNNKTNIIKFINIPVVLHLIYIG